MSNKINNLRKVIKDYIKLNNEIKLIEDQVKDKRKKKNSLEKYLIETFKQNNINKKEIAVTSRQSLLYIESEKKEALSQKFIKKSLVEYFIKNYSHSLRKERCEKKAQEIFEFLLANRDDKKSFSIKLIENR